MKELLVFRKLKICMCSKVDVPQLVSPVDDCVGAAFDWMLS